jgi:hypothetical protein
VDTLEHPDGTEWVLFTWPMLALMLFIAVLAGVVIGGLIGRATSR